MLLETTLSRKVEELPTKTQIAILVAYYAISIGLVVGTKLYINHKTNQELKRLMETRRIIEEHNRALINLAMTEDEEEEDEENDFRYYIF